jgi:hypothetical protein
MHFLGLLRLAQFNSTICWNILNMKLALLLHPLICYTVMFYGQSAGNHNFQSSGILRDYTLKFSHKFSSTQFVCEYDIVQ